MPSPSDLDGRVVLHSSRARTHGVLVVAAARHGQTGSVACRASALSSRFHACSDAGSRLLLLAAACLLGGVDCAT